MVYRSAPPNSNDIIYVWNASELKYVDSLTSTKSCFILRAVCELKYEMATEQDSLKELHAARDK